MRLASVPSNTSAGRSLASQAYIFAHSARHRSASAA